MRRRRSLVMIACACALGTLAGELTQAAGVHNQAKNVARHAREPYRTVENARAPNVLDPVALETPCRPGCLLQTDCCWEARTTRASEALVARQQEMELPGIAVLVYNYAGVSADTMSLARERVTRL